MQTYVIDFETYYDKDYSLKKLPPLLYVRSPKFKAHGASIKVNDEPAFWVKGEELPDYFESVKWDDVIGISHNSYFDMLVLYERYGRAPAQYVDTLGLARALLPHDADFDLDTLGKLLGVGGKHDDGKVIQKIRGLKDLPPELEEELAKYAIIDAEREYGIFQKLWPHLPEEERYLLHMTIRMAVQGTLHFNHSTAREALKEANEKRNARIANSGLDLAVLRSSAKFAEELRKRGVEPPMKKSPKTGKLTYAFSKQDREFLDLLDNPDVAHLVDGRLAAMSNGDITRIERLLAITSFEPHTIPMPTAYCAAHTFRWGGTGGINVQNLKKGPDGKAGKLRESFEAPPGYNIHVSDSAQIELRLNLWFCGEHEALDVLRKGGDTYCMMATSLFGREITKEHKKERQFGKIVELGCGYGMGDRKFRAMCAIGPMGNPPIFLSEEEAKNTIATYRATRINVVNTWRWLNDFAIPRMTDPDCHIERRPVVFKYERIELPFGLSLLYPNLHFHVDEETGDGYWCYGLNGVRHKIYGGLLLENIIQALARGVIGYQMARIDREIEHARVVSSTHDEVIAVAPEKYSEEVQQRMIQIMSEPPPWAPDLPVKGEGGYAKTYSK